VNGLQGSLTCAEMIIDQYYSGRAASIALDRRLVVGEFFVSGKRATPSAQIPANVADNQGMKS